jgi:hypothetical protein
MSDITLHNMATDVKLLMKELDKCSDIEEQAIMMYGVIRALKDKDADLSIEKAIDYSKQNWSDLYR